MNRENIYEEFYGPSMESEIVGQEFLSSLVGASALVGVTVLAGWSVYHVLKHSINAVKKAVKDSRDKKEKGATVNKMSTDDYVKFASPEEYSEFLDRFIKVVKGSKSKLAGNEDKKYPYLYAFSQLFGEKFKVDPQPYYDKTKLMEDFNSIIKGTDLPEEELYGESLYLNIHPSTLRRDETSYYDDFISENVVVSLVEKNGKHGLSVKGPKKTLVFMEDDKIENHLTKLALDYVKDLKTANDSQRKELIEDFCYTFVKNVIIDQGNLDVDVYDYVSKELGINIKQYIKDGDLNDYYFLEQCFFNILYTGPKTK